MREITEATDVAMEENAKANQLLASGENAEIYRKAKDRERYVADNDLAQAQAECKAEIGRLEEGWFKTESTYMNEMSELQAEVRSMRQRLDKNSREVEQVLAKQSSEWGNHAEDVGKQITQGMKALEDLRASKTQHLHREVQLCRRRERDIAASTQLQLEGQLNEVRLHCKTKLATEELKLGDVLNAERRSVEQSKRTADMWGKRVLSMREAYRAHAYKTGAYMLAMEVAPRKTPSRSPSPQWAL
jgi:hypothetical protein